MSVLQYIAVALAALDEILKAGGNAAALLAQLRTTLSMTKTVSTVDDVDTSAGQIALAYAVAVEASGRAGQYGTGSGAQAPLPTPPTPSASPAATPTPSS